jgi:hypothetical protein
MRTDSEVVVFGSPMAVGHVRPLMPLAARLVGRGFDVIWAISGDPNEPASVWKEPLAKMGVTFIDVDAVAPFARHDAFPSNGADSVYPRAARNRSRASPRRPCRRCSRRARASGSQRRHASPNA